MSETIKTKDMRLLELTDPDRRDIRDILADAYEEEGNIAGVAKRLNLDDSTVSKWITILGGGIQRRSEVVFEGHQRRPREARTAVPA